MFRLVLCLAVVTLATADTLFFKPSSKNKGTAVICPDKKSSCPNHNTCCLLPSKKYGCCPLPQATCCSDHLHCCPHGNTCDPARGTCRSTAGVTTPWLEKRPATQHHQHQEERTNIVHCPGGIFKCPDNNKCCKMINGPYGCCPFKNGVCCSVGMACCPEGYTCDFSHGSCVKAGAEKVLLGKMQEALQVKTGAASSKKNLPPKIPASATKKVNAPPEQLKKMATLKASLIKAKQLAQKAAASKPGKATGSQSIPKAPHSVKLKVAQPNVKLKNFPKATVPKTPPTKPLGKAPLKQVKIPPKPTKVPSKPSQEKIEVKKTTSSSDKKSKGKEGKKMMEHITDTIHATVSAIKNTVHRVVSGGKGKDASKPTKDTKTEKSTKTIPKEQNQPASVGRKDVKPKPKVTIPHTKAIPADSKKILDQKAKLAQQKKIQQKILQQKIAQQKVSSKKVDPKKEAQQKLIQQKLAQQTLGQQKLAKQNLVQQKVAQQKIAQLKLAQQKVMQQKIAQQKLAAQKLAQQKSQKKSQQKATAPKIGQKQKLEQQAKLVAFKIQQAKAQALKSAQAKSQVAKQKAAQLNLKTKKTAQQAKAATTAQQKAQAIKVQQLKLQQQKAQAFKLQQQQKQMQHLKAQALKKQQQQKKAQTMKQTQSQHKVKKQAPQHMGVGRKLLGLAWRFLGGQPSVDEVLMEDQLLETVGSQKEEDFDDTATGEMLAPEENEVEIIEEDAIDTVGEEHKCPDKSTCPDDATCCQMESGEYACCPERNAQCCSDHIHCCPQNEKCNVQAGRCDSESGTSSKLLRKFPATRPQLRIQPILVGSKTHEEEKANDLVVICPDQGQCPDKFTCCQLASGEYGCCPLPKAVCCPDKLHCCPHGYTCGDQGCSQGDTQIAWFTKIPARKQEDKLSNVQCDATHYCPSGTTCCVLASGQWGCCPIPEAVCCADHQHCCPSGYTCNDKDGSCERGLDGEKQVAWFTKFPALKQEDKLSNVRCDSTHYCPSGTTCCVLASGQWGCCPVPQAVCCADKMHCCPNGYTCNAGTCVRGLDGEKQVAWFTKFPALKQEDKLSNVQCDATDYCPSGTTCCVLASGQWGCCPVPQAVCCADHQHCCPNGYTCNAGTCVRGLDGEKQVAWFTKFPALKQEDKLSNVQCDATHYCPSGTTCCVLASGQWGCCPIPEAVCCADHQHCCPSGYTCNDKDGSCERGLDGEKQVAWFTKFPALKQEDKLSNVRCDSTHYCPSGTTCCVLASGQWGCCPVPQAVCCADHQHCCPNGYTCNAGTCVRGLDGEKQVAWFTKFPARKQEDKLSNVQCDATHYCPSGTTCCVLASGQWGCCPIPEAVCCADHQHCCPSGYTCNDKDGSCERGLDGEKQVAWFTKFPALKQEDKLSNVRCDSTHYCPSGTTCCVLTSGQWGCCLVPQAVCCADHQHCCPNGYTCNAGTCVRGLDGEKQVVAWFTKFPALKQEDKLSDVICPDGQHQCPSGNTCCALASGDWGCCPLPEAVCCADKMHCCPNGYTCNDKDGSCERGLEAVPWSTKQPALPRKLSKVDGIICPGGQVECPDQATCCRMKSGKWGCCPFSDAVCCSDGLHCCPQYSTCNVKSHMCEQHSSSIQVSSTLLIPRAKVALNMALKRPATTRLNGPLTIVKCDDGSTCSDGNTCCANSKGKFACCPHPQGVCCADKVHCCPKGYTCNMKSGTICKKPPNILNSLFFKHFPLRSTPQAQSLKVVTCPDEETPCPEGSTCCALQSGGYGCCNIPNAVCCGSFCCSQGQTCSPTGRTCIAKVAARPLVTKAGKPQVCAANTLDSCPPGNTCCQLPDKKSWGCCPSKQAVCCENGRHCCPQGTVCGEKAGECVPEEETNRVQSSDSAKQTAAFLTRAVKGGHILY